MRDVARLDQPASGRDLLDRVVARAQADRPGQHEREFVLPGVHVRLDQRPRRDGDLQHRERSIGLAGADAVLEHHVVEPDAARFVGADDLRFHLHSLLDLVATARFGDDPPPCQARRSGSQPRLPACGSMRGGARIPRRSSSLARPTGQTAALGVEGSPQAQSPPMNRRRVRSWPMRRVRMRGCAALLVLRPYCELFRGPASNPRGSTWTSSSFSSGSST